MFESDAKLILIFCLLPLVIGNIAAIIVPNLMRESCANRVIEEVRSPDGNHKAVVFIRTCSAREVSTELSVLQSDKYLPTGAGNVFTAQGKIRVRWQDNTHLHVIYPAGAKRTCQQEVVPGIRLSCEEDTAPSSSH